LAGATFHSRGFRGLPRTCAKYRLLKAKKIDQYCAVFCAITRKQCEEGCKLVLLFSNKNTAFVWYNNRRPCIDTEVGNGRYFAYNSTEFELLN